jgi:hypothetical protein
MALAVAERGEPMSFEEIRQRLTRIGILVPISSLKKSWAGRPPLRKTHAGKLALDKRTDPYAWERILFNVREHLGLWHKKDEKTNTAESPEVDVESPLTPDELSTSNKHGWYWLSTRRSIAAVVDATGRSLSIGEVIERLKPLCGRTLSPEEVKRSLIAKGSYVSRDAEDRVHLHTDHGDLKKVRHVIRTKVADFRHEEDDRRRVQEMGEAYRKKQQAAEEAQRQCYLSCQKAAIRAFFLDDRFIAASVLDPDSREFEDILDAAELKERLDSAGFILGLDVWPDLDRIGFDPGERFLVDLKNLWQLYEYGRQHQFVRIHKGLLDEIEHVSWNPGHLPTLLDVFKQAAEQGTPLDVVMDSAPGWDDPWARAVRVLCLGTFGMWGPDVMLEYLGDGRRERVFVGDVQAVRSAEVRR